MSDRLPGSAYDNPIWYRGYRIYLSDLHATHDFQFQFSHDNYDGPPDRRCGLAHSIPGAKKAIDEIEDESH